METFHFYKNLKKQMIETSVTHSIHTVAKRRHRTVSLKSFDLKGSFGALPPPPWRLKCSTAFAFGSQICSTLQRLASSLHSLTSTHLVFWFPLPAALSAGPASLIIPTGHPPQSATGSHFWQGEPQAAPSWLAAQQHSALRVVKG